MMKQSRVEQRAEQSRREGEERAEQTQSLSMRFLLADCLCPRPFAFADEALWLGSQTRTTRQSCFLSWRSQRSSTSRTLTWRRADIRHAAAGWHGHSAHRPPPPVRLKRADRSGARAADLTVSALARGGERRRAERRRGERGRECLLTASAPARHARSSRCGT